MTRKTAVLASVAMIAAAAIYSAVVYPGLPAQVPIHFDLQGKPDGWDDPLTACLIGPGLMILMLLLLLALPKISPKAYKIEPFEPTYNLIITLLVALFGVVHVLALEASQRGEFSSPRLLLVVIFVFVAVLGNFLGRIRRNFWMGVRTPWTLANETVWNVVHRRAGQLWVATGVIGAALMLFGAPLWLALGLLIAAALIPVVHSYFVWRRLEPQA